MPKKNEKTVKQEKDERAENKQNKPPLQFIALAIVMIMAVFLLLQPPPVKKDDAKEAKELYFKGLTTGKDKTMYTYEYREMLDNYPVNITLLKGSSSSAVFIFSPVSEKRIYFFGENDTVGCLRILDKNATCTMIEKSNIAVDEYTQLLKAKFFDNSKIERTEENMKLLFDKGGLKFKPQINNKTVNGMACREIEYTIDYDMLTIGDAEKLGIGPGTPRQFQAKSCISETEGPVEKTFNYQYKNKISTTYFILLREKWVEPRIDKPENVLDIAFYDMLAEESSIVNEITVCFVNEQDRERCVFQFSIDRKYAPACDLAEKKRDACVISVATLKNDTSLCNTVRSGDFRDDCYIEFAGLNRDSTMCSMIMNQSKTAYCLNVSKAG